MDIHRCRFVPYQPQSINTLAFSHAFQNPKHKTPADLRLALGRENGDIEIWNPLNGSWVQERILRGSCDRTVEQLAWTQQLVVDEDNKEKPIENGAIRLFSSGGSSSITEWSLNSGMPVRHAESNSGDIWCFAAQPQWKRHTATQEVGRAANAPCQLLAAGCSDGSIVLFSTADETLQFLRVLVKSQEKKAKVISITWRDRNTIVAGFENSTIKVIDVLSRKVLRLMSLGKTPDNSECIVWAVRCLPDGTILSGDSSGELKIWDAKTYSLVQRLKTHEADILDIATSANGDMICTAGVDRRTVNYRPVALQAGSKNDRWQQVAHRRYHQHDVKTLATFESKTMSVLVSGGMDTVPVVLPLRNLDSEYHRSLTHLPQKPQMSCSTKGRLMLTWWGRDLFLFHLPKKIAEVEMIDSLQGGSSSHKLVARLQLSGDENITSAQISDDGKLLTAATSAGVRLFQLRKRTDSETGEIEVRTRQVDLPIGLRAYGASSVGFSPDAKWLYALRTSNIITMIKLVSNSSSKEKPSINSRIVKLDRKQRQSYQSNHGNYIRYINCISFSSDSRIIAAGDLSGAVDAWVLEGHEDLSIQQNGTKNRQSDASSDSDSDSDSEDESDLPVIHGQKWSPLPGGSTLPQLDAAILALSFKPHHSDVEDQNSTLGLHPTRHNPHPVSHELPSTGAKLIVVTSMHTVVEFDVLSAKLSDWSRRNPSSHLPVNFTQIKDRVMGAFWDCSSRGSEETRERLWLYGPGWLFMLDISQDLDFSDSLEKIGKLGKYDVKEPSSATSEKRRAMQAATEQRLKKRKRNTGAGDQVKKGEWQRIEVPEVEEGIEKKQETPTGLLSPISDSEDEDIDMADPDALTLLRRKDDETQFSNTKPNSKDDLALTVKSTISARSYFTTFRYRAIFGIAVLSPSPDRSKQSPPPPEDEEAVNNHGLEIVIVERPMYDVELLPRFDGGQDWQS